MGKLKLLIAVLAMTAMVLGSESVSAKKKLDKQTMSWRYDIEYVKTGGNGMVVVKVWSYAKKPALAIEQGKKNAVHGIIFKGYSSTGGGTVSQRPLAQGADAQTQHREFFDEFFADGGQYMKYVSGVADGSTEIRKVGKEYKAGIVVTVNKDMLRSDLEAAGIIRGLSSGF